MGICGSFRTTTAFYNGPITASHGIDPNADAIAWYVENSGATTHQVKSKLPNAWGLYDMSGNAQEWVWDWEGFYPGDVTDPSGPTAGDCYAPGYWNCIARVSRGGGWNTEAWRTRVACRRNSTPSSRGIGGGFRLVRTASSTGAKALYGFHFGTNENAALTDDVSATIEATAISITVPNGTDRSTLVASFTLSSGAAAAVGGCRVTSGVTVNDFSNPVTYVVTAEDGSTLSYTVTVSEAAGVCGDGVIDLENGESRDDGNTVTEERALLTVRQAARSVMPAVLRWRVPRPIVAMGCSMLAE